VAKIVVFLKPRNYSGYFTAMSLFILKPSAFDTLQPGRQLPMYSTNALLFYCGRFYPDINVCGHVYQYCRDRYTQATSILLHSIVVIIRGEV
jgi:hypothetical protein